MTQAADKKIIFLFALFLIFSAFFCVSVGSTSIFSPSDWGQVLSCSVQQTHSDFCEIFWFRLTRTLTAMYVGGALALSGAVLQSVLANPIADPFVLGVSSGGTAAAILSAVFLPGFFVGSLSGPSIAAFAGCLLTFVFLLGAQSFLERYMQIGLLPVIGLILNSFFAAVILIILTIFANENTGEIYRWFVGNIFDVGMRQIGFSFILGSFAAGILLFYAPLIKQLAFGDLFFLNTGFSAKNIRFIALICTTFLIATTVSVSGAIGFVGLIVPHIIKSVLSTKIRVQWTACLLLGGSIICIADGLSRVIAAPTELPVGLFTACFGIPALAMIFLNRAQRGEHI